MQVVQLIAGTNSIHSNVIVMINTNNSIQSDSCFRQKLVVMRFFIQI